MEHHRRRELLKIRQSFLERYKLAKQFKDKFYTEKKYHHFKMYQ